MNAETLRKKGQEILFREDLRTYRRAVVGITSEAVTNKDLSDPQVVLSCLDKLDNAMRQLWYAWFMPMRELQSHDDDLDPELSKDSGNVGLHSLT